MVEEGDTLPEGMVVSGAVVDTLLVEALAETNLDTKGSFETVQRVPLDAL